MGEFNGALAFGNDSLSINHLAIARIANHSLEAAIQIFSSL